MKRTRAVLAFVVAAFVCPELVERSHAQDSGQRKPGVTISFRGLGVSAPNVFGRPRRFAPITALLQNDGATDAEGLLRVYRSQEVAAGVAFSAVPEQDLFYQRFIKIPRGGKRIEEISYYCQDKEPDRICVAFESTTGETVVAAPHPKLDLRPNDLLALSITSSDQDDAVSLAGAPVPGPRRFYELQVKHADPASLPERPEGYGAFDLVIVSGLDPRSVSKQQVRALMEWVELGGDLLVAYSGKETEGLGSPEDEVLPALPAPGAPLVTQDLHALEPLVPDAAPMERVQTSVRRVIAKAGARVIGGTSDNPLIVRGRHGAGRITYFAFPLATLKTSWGTDKGSGGKTILSFAAHAPAEDLDSFQPSPIAPPLEEVLLNLTEALKTLDPPSSLLVAPLLILYVTLVAPLNYLVLTRLGKRDLAMASAAIIAVVFGAVFYGIGWYVHGTGALVARGAIVELPASAEGRARIETMTGFFSTDRGVLDATAPKGAFVAPIAERASGRKGEVVQPAGGGDVTLKALELDTWSLRRFRATRLEKVGALVADLRYAGAHIVGTVENKTPWRIETPVILIGERFIELADIPAGETAKVDRILPAERRTGGLALDQRIRRGLDAHVFKPRYGDASSYGPGGGDPFGGDMGARFRASLFRRAQAVNAGPGAVPALIAGCVDQDMGGVDLDTKAKIELARALVLSEVAIDASGPEIAVREVPGLVVRARGYDAFSGATGSPARLGFVPQTNEDGYVTFEWRLPASRELPLALSRLEVAWSFANEPEKDR
ncbi:MAG: hypothetical protein ACAI25_04985, partial [Planctomycetota bacterium]